MNNYRIKETIISNDTGYEKTLYTIEVEETFLFWKYWTAVTIKEFAKGSWGDSYTYYSGDRLEYRRYTFSNLEQAKKYLEYVKSDNHIETYKNKKLYKYRSLNPAYGTYIYTDWTVIDNTKYGTAYRTFDSLEKLKDVIDKSIKTTINNIIKV
jgi:hypothetical protein